MARYNIIIEDTDENEVDVYPVIEPHDSKETNAINLGDIILSNIKDMLEGLDRQ